MGYIKKEAILNLPLTFTTNNTHDADLISEVLKAVMDYVKGLPDENVVEKTAKTAVRRKKTT